MKETYIITAIAPDGVTLSPQDGGLPLVMPSTPDLFKFVGQVVTIQSAVVTCEPAMDEVPTLVPEPRASMRGITRIYWRDRIESEVKRAWAIQARAPGRLRSPRS